jgi:uncharacterized protein (DUF1697 family)
MTDIQYAAFLRGINITGKSSVKMETLRCLFEELGFKNVKTILASGNVFFETDLKDKQVLEKKIENILPMTIGFESDVFIRTIDDLHKLEILNPFKDTKIASQTTFYVTFVKGKPRMNLQFPSNVKGYEILGIFYNTVCSVIDLTSIKTPQLMQILEKEFGKSITTRNWNTIVRMLKVSSEGPD